MVVPLSGVGHNGLEELDETLESLAVWAHGVYGWFQGGTQALQFPLPGHLVGEARLQKNDAPLGLVCFPTPPHHLYALHFTIETP